MFFTIAYFCFGVSLFTLSNRHFFLFIVKQLFKDFLKFGSNPKLKTNLTHVLNLALHMHMISNLVNSHILASCLVQSSIIITLFLTCRFTSRSSSWDITLSLLNYKSQMRYISQHNHNIYITLKQVPTLAHVSYRRSNNSYDCLINLSFKLYDCRLLYI